ncbi:hypothetical protein KY334_06120 [Candidatus Woesearchaeota archaeon]|nr:hypothetical protein [Candidatus Woesearchaeota archaeon]
MKFYIDGPFEKSYEIANMYEKILFANHELVNNPKDKSIESIISYKKNQSVEINSIMDCNVFIHVSDSEFYNDTFYLGFAICKYITKGNPFIYVIGNGNSERYSHPVVNRIKEINLINSLEKILKDFSNSKD